MPDKVSSEPGRRVALVLSGGVALGAYQAGAYEALCDGRGLDPGWIAGASVGSVNAAIIAGNPPERRVERLRQFWTGASASLLFLPLWGSLEHGPLREGYNMANAVQSLVLGRPGVFRPRLIPSAGDRPGLYDLAPLAERLEELIDFRLLNDGAIRLSVATTDIVSGERVVFDTRRSTRLRPEHVLASCALLPGFSPIEVDGRLLGDGGFSGNTPVDLVLDEPGGDDLLCFVVDLFAREGSRPRTVGAAANRALDLAFGNQTWLLLDGRRRERQLSAAARRLAEQLPPELREKPEFSQFLESLPAGAATVLYMAYRAATDEAGLIKMFDFSNATVEERWKAGGAHMQAALRTLGTLPPQADQAGLSIHEVPL